MFGNTCLYLLLACFNVLAINSNVISDINTPNSVRQTKFNRRFARNPPIVHTTTAKPTTRKVTRKPRTRPPYEPLEMEKFDTDAPTEKSAEKKKVSSSKIAFYIVLGIGIPIILLTALGFFLFIYCRKHKAPKPKTASQQCSAQTLASTPTSTKQLPSAVVAIVAQSPAPSSTAPSKPRTPPPSSQTPKETKSPSNQIKDKSQKCPPSIVSNSSLILGKDKSNSVKSIKVPKKENKKVEKKVKKEDEENSLTGALGLPLDSAEVATWSIRPPLVPVADSVAPDKIPPEKFSHKGPLVLKKYSKVDLNHELDDEPDRQVLDSDHITWDDRHQVHEMGSEVEVVISNKSNSIMNPASKSTRNSDSKKKSKSKSEIATQ